MEEVKIIDYGTINFGVRFKGKKWSEVPTDWLKYVMTDDCWTTDENKATAKKVLGQANLIKGQLEMFKEKNNG